jgi:nitroreductase
MTTLPLSPDELLTTTRSVRKRLDLSKPVPLELIKECIEVALQAPSASNRQTWHWIVVTEPELRAKIGELYRKSHTAYAAKGGAARLYADDPDRNATQLRVVDSSTHLAEHMGEVPVMVIACQQADALPEGNQAAVWGSIIPAAWSYMLAARARGLGSAWTTLHLEYEREVAELLGIPGDIHQAVLLPTAYYTGETFKRAPRQPLDSVLHVNTW